MMMKKLFTPKAPVVGKVVRQLNNLRVSEEQLKATWYKVRRELRQQGLLAPGMPLDEVQVGHEGVLTMSGIKALWPPKPAMGFYHYSDGNIHVPGICFADFWPWLQGRVLVDVLRHEYGHALEDKYPRYFHGREFKRAFGKEYGTERSGDEEADHFVSDYAMEATQEDFAETFMYYMKYKGEIPKKWSSNRAICAKWTFIDGLCAKFAEACEEP